MIILPCAQIAVPPRVRQVMQMEKVNELADSIKAIGLLHPIVVRKDDGMYTLVAGETRLRAVQKLHAAGEVFTYANVCVLQDCIPATSLGELPPDIALEMELEENIRRTDVPWTDSVRATDRLHKLRQKQHPGWKPEDTAKELNLSNPTVQVTQRLQLADFLDRPEIAKAPNIAAARRVLAGVLEAEFTQQLANQQKSSVKLQLIEGDCRPEMLELPSGTFDLILTDAPYGQNADQIDANMPTTHKYDDSYGSWLQLMSHVSGQMFELAAVQAHLYMFCNVENFFALRPIMEEAGWVVWPRPLIWVKNGGQSVSTDYGPPYRYECILFANKGRKPLTKVGQGDVLQYPIVNDKRHPAEKPVPLLLDLLQRSLPKNIGHVLDPFVGSGATFEACAKHGVTCVGIEQEPEYIAMCKVRIGAIEGLEAML